MSNGKKLLIAFGIGMVSFLGVALLTLSKGTLAPIVPDESLLIYELEGNGDGKSSQPFHAPDNWQLRWDFQDKGENATRLEVIRWTKADGKSSDIVAMHRKPIRAGGGVYISEGGDYELLVEGTGPWKIRAYQFNQPKPQ